LLLTYGDINSVTRMVADTVVILIEKNPEFHGKLRCPPCQRLYRLLKQRFHSIFNLKLIIYSHVEPSCMCMYFSIVGILTIHLVSLNWGYLPSNDPMQVPETRTFLLDHIGESSLNPSSLRSEDNNSIENPRSGKYISTHNS